MDTYDNSYCKLLQSKIAMNTINDEKEYITRKLFDKWQKSIIKSIEFNSIPKKISFLSIKS